MRTCKKCGAQFPDEYSFCSNCGERYTEDAPKRKDKTTDSLINNEQFRRFLPIGIGILGVIIALSSNMKLGLIIIAAAIFYAYMRI